MKNITLLTAILAATSNKISYSYKQAIEILQKCGEDPEASIFGVIFNRQPIVPKIKIATTSTKEER